MKYAKDYPLMSAGIEAARSVLQEQAAEVGAAMARKLEVEIRLVVDAFWRRTDWMPGELVGRATMTHLPNGHEEFAVDGVRLLRIYPIEISPLPDTVPFTMHVTRNVARLHASAADLPR